MRGLGVGRFGREVRMEPTKPALLSFVEPGDDEGVLRAEVGIERGLRDASLGEQCIDADVEHAVSLAQPIEGIQQARSRRPGWGVGGSASRCGHGAI